MADGEASQDYHQADLLQAQTLVRLHCQLRSEVPQMAPREQWW